MVIYGPKKEALNFSDENSEFLFECLALQNESTKKLKDKIEKFRIANNKRK